MPPIPLTIVPGGNCRGEPRPTSPRAPAFGSRHLSERVLVADWTDRQQLYINFTLVAGPRHLACWVGTSGLGRIEDDLGNEAACVPVTTAQRSTERPCGAVGYRQPEACAFRP